MIEIQNVRTQKYGKPLFEDLNWQIHEGEHWVIRGKNASGKTQLLELLAGKSQLSQGRVKYSFMQDKDGTAYFDALRKRINYIPAHAAHVLLKKYDGLFYQQRYYGSFNEGIPLVRDLFEDKFDQLEALALPPNFRIDSLMDLSLTRLSNGQFKKVLIIQHLLEGETKLLLLDYPFEGLDHDSRIQLSAFIEHIVTEHQIQLILTDHYHDLPKLINRTLTLEDFKIKDTAPFHAEYSTEEESSPKKTFVTSDQQVVVEMKDLKIQYGQKVILKDFNWKIQAGEKWALLGDNGSGKTTIFSLIYADHPLAYSQEVYLFGKKRGSGESIWDIKKRISYLGPELISFLNPRGIRSLAYDYILNQPGNPDENALKVLIDFFDAEALFQLPVFQLSSGQLQLMLLIQYFLDDKELLLLDEPFQFLDPAQKERVSQYLQHYLDREKTLILVTHYQKDIADWTEQIKRI